MPNDIQSSLSRVAGGLIEEGVTPDEIVKLVDNLLEADFPKTACTLAMIAGYLAGKEVNEDR